MLINQNFITKMKVERLLGIKSRIYLQIVYINRESGSTDLEVIDPQRDYEITISTCGEFLNRCVPEAREEIIERLIKLQNNEEEYRKVKTADESMWEDIENELEDEEEMED